MSDATPTLSQSRREVHTGRPPGGERPVEEPVSGDAVALRGAPRRTAATPAVARRATVTASIAGGLVQTVWVLNAITETIIGLRVLFHAVSANSGTAVVRFIDYLSAPLMAPFGGIVDDYKLSNGGRLDIAALITMAVYLVAAFIVTRIIRIGTARRTVVAA